MHSAFQNYQRAHSQLLRHTREWFWSQGILEVETPLLAPTPNIEAHLDSFRVARSGIHKSPQADPEQGPNAGYLITSPEFALKELLLTTQSSLFQIAHCFREGDQGDWHTEEFLMLEWYLVDANLEQLMDFCDSYLVSLNTQPYSRIEIQKAQRLSVGELFHRYLSIEARLPSLQAVAQQYSLSAPQAIAEMAFDDLFFLIFLNLVEPELARQYCGQFVYLYDYPAELAQFSKIQNGLARRFEIYYGQLELANAYQELQSAEEYHRAFKEQQRKRQLLNQSEVAIDQDWLHQLQQLGPLPNCSGIALGLDRLLALLCKSSDLASVSPFYRPSKAEI